jgi:hypothetical protein
MGKPKLITTRPYTVARLLAPQVGEKLEAAEARLAGLKTQIAELALDDALARPGAPEKLAAQNKQIGGAQTAADQLRLAHRLALAKDARATAEARNRIRAAQFAAMQNHARGRFEAMVEMCVGLETAAKAYRRYLVLTDKMAAALPIGTTFPPGMSAHPEQGGILPGAHPMTLSLADRPHEAEPISESVKRINEHFLSAVKDQIEAMEQAEEERRPAAAGALGGLQELGGGGK